MSEAAFEAKQASEVSKLASEKLQKLRNKNQPDKKKPIKK